MDNPAPSHEWLLPPGGAPAGGGCLRLAGDWRHAVQGLPPPPHPFTGPLRVDASQLTAWDTQLAACLREQLAPLARRGVLLQLDGLPPDVRALLQMALRLHGPATSTDPSIMVPPGPGGGAARQAARRHAHQAAHQAALTITFIGETLLATGRWLAGRSAARGFAGAEVWRQVDRCGAMSLPVVALTCGLVGLMLAYMGGAQLDRMGGQTYVADIVTVGMVRELAGLMTGVILAGRVGAAFAAELATMQAGEEIDALRVLGVDPIDHLVLPRLLALVLVAPPLMAFGALAGVLAGAVPATLAFGLTLSEYLHKCLAALTWTHLWIGVFKCVLYAALLSLAGCREGLHAGRNAQAVGQATTTAVVKGLVWIIAAAAGSTVVLQSLGF
ncbi:MAG: ABC transporter permease [Rubrivivax sp.]|nr:ABC transporter permease [Rubrivivax sp.]